MNKYCVVLKLKDDEHPCYFLTVYAESEEIAIDKAKRYLAENGYWWSKLSFEERMECIDFMYFEESF